MITIFEQNGATQALKNNSNKQIYVCDWQKNFSLVVIANISTQTFTLQLVPTENNKACEEMVGLFFATCVGQPRSTGNTKQHRT